MSEVENLEEDVVEQSPPIPVPANIPVYEESPVKGGVPASMLARFKKSR